MHENVSHFKLKWSTIFQSIFDNFTVTFFFKRCIYFRNLLFYSIFRQTWILFKNLWLRLLTGEEVSMELILFFMFCSFFINTYSSPILGWHTITRSASITSQKVLPKIRLFLGIKARISVKFRGILWFICSYNILQRFFIISWCDACTVLSRSNCVKFVLLNLLQFSFFQNEVTSSSWVHCNHRDLSWVLQQSQTNVYPACRWIYTCCSRTWEANWSLFPK